MFSDKVKRQLTETDPLRVRLPQGTAARNTDPGVSGESAVPSAPRRRRESQR